MPDTKRCEIVVHALFAVAAVGGDGAGFTAGPGDDPLHGLGQLRGVGGVPRFHVVVHDDTVVVVHDLRFAAELHRLPQPAFGDRPGIGVVQADLPTRPGRGGPGYPQPGLRRDLPGRIQQAGQVVHRPMEPSPAATRDRVSPTGGRQLLRPTQRPSGIDQHLLRILGGGLGQVGQLTGDPLDHGLRLVAALGSAHRPVSRQSRGPAFRRRGTGPAAVCGPRRRRP